MDIRSEFPALAQTVYGRPLVGNSGKGKFSRSVKLEGMRRERIRYDTMIY